MGANPTWKRALAVWVGLTGAFGIVAAATLDSDGGEREEVAASSDGSPPAPRRSATSSTTSSSTTVAPETTTTVAVAPVETTAPPVTAPTTTAPPVEEVVAVEPPVVVPSIPAPPGFEIILGPEMNEAYGTPYIHLRGTGCTGPGHTNGERFTHPFEYGVSAELAGPDGTLLIRTDPDHSQPGSGDWTQGFPAVEGPGDYLVTAYCVGADPQVDPATGWVSPLIVYTTQLISVP